MSFPAHGKVISTGAQNNASAALKYQLIADSFSELLTLLVEQVGKDGEADISAKGVRIVFQRFHSWYRDVPAEFFDSFLFDVTQEQKAMNLFAKTMRTLAMSLLDDGLTALVDYFSQLPAGPPPLPPPAAPAAGLAGSEVPAAAAAQASGSEASNGAAAPAAGLAQVPAAAPEASNGAAAPAAVLAEVQPAAPASEAPDGAAAPAAGHAAATTSEASDVAASPAAGRADSKAVVAAAAAGHASEDQNGASAHAAGLAESAAEGVAAVSEPPTKVQRLECSLSAEAVQGASSAVAQPAVAAAAAVEGETNAPVANPAAAANEGAAAFQAKVSQT